ncbi:UvrD-helicase domain-containing protein [Planctomicrobium sp. SH668]|uniref:UvrD-helicase domain-containing protein n=1 Tax=Planctomicrobium sp. SH668 TaxID=3448126 RepID=UPI003F5CA2E7
MNGKRQKTMFDDSTDISGEGALDTPRLLIRASAGTGKTFQLSSRYIELLRFASPEKILASTFTRKAAGEILERILLRLARATVSEKSLKELAASISYPDLSRQECLQMLAQFTRQLHRVRISTLDGFFAQLAGSQSLELGFPSGWRILDPVEVQDLKTQALETMLREGDQKELVQLMHLLDKGDSSRSVSGLMRSTIDDMYSIFIDSSEESWDRFPEHKFLTAEHREELLQGMAQLQTDQKRIQTAVANDSQAIREERWEDFLSKGLMPKIRSTERTYYNKPIPENVCAYYEEIGEHSLAVTASSWRQQTKAARRLLSDFHAVFEKLKYAAGGLEFGDITRRLAMSQRVTSRRDTTFRMDGAIEHLLLDEFQDTSRPQWEVIQSFADEACRLPNRSFFCVGDVKQAIYGWRGGEATIFDAIEQQLPNLTSRPLNLSYRSSPVVIDAVNQVMTKLSQHNNLVDHAELLFHWCRQFPIHETTRKDLTGYVCLRTGPELPEGEDETPSSIDQKAAFWTYAAEYVADLARSTPQASIGVLMRGNTAVGRMIYELSRLGVEASEEGGNPLTDSAGVHLILQLMRLADHPGDTIAAYCVSGSPLGVQLGFGSDATANQRTQVALGLRRELMQHGYGPVVHNLVNQLSGVCNRREFRRLRQLAVLADRYDTLFDSLRPSEFVTFVESQRIQEPTNAQIRVMNIHQSKGLEFDIVVLPELNPPLALPPRYVTKTSTPGGPPELVALYRSEEHFASLGGELMVARMQTRDKLVQEALCLLYVALTRAARSLHMLIPPKVTKGHPKNFAGLVRAALAPNQPMEPMSLLWEHGDPQWAVPETEAYLAAQEAIALQKTSPPEVTPLRFAESKRKRHLIWTSPTGKRGKHPKPPSSSTTQSTPSTRLSGAERGTLFHQWAETIEWLDEEKINLSKMRSIASLSGLDDREFDVLSSEFMQSMNFDSVKNLFSRDHCLRSYLQTQSKEGSTSFSCEVLNEFRFLETSADGELINGAIDRLVIISENDQPVAVQIIDFKTDDLKGGEPSAELVSYYQSQLAAYSEAVVKIWKVEPSQVQLSLVFLQTGAVAHFNNSVNR